MFVIVAITLALTYTPMNTSIKQPSPKALLLTRSSGDKQREDTGLIVYDLSKPVPNASIKCTNLTTIPTVPICFHTKADYLSAHFMRGSIWEYHVISKMKTLLGSDCRYGLIDIGANIGYYSLIAAAMGHNVVAVEPLDINVIRLHKATKLAGSEDKIFVIQNALSNVRGESEMVVFPSNIGGSAVTENCRTNFRACSTVSTVYLDDILPHVSFKRAIMKMDIEGYEHRAILKGSELFAKIDIPYVFMEFMKLKPLCDFNGTKQSQGWLHEMFNFFTSSRYTPFSAERRLILQISICNHWPDDVLWIKSGMPYPLPWPMAIN